MTKGDPVYRGTTVRLRAQWPIVGERCKSLSHAPHLLSIFIFIRVNFKVSKTGTANLFPRCDLIIGINPWHVRETARFARDNSCLGNQKCSWYTGTLGIIFRNQWTWDMRVVGTESSKRRKYDAMFEVKFADFDGLEEF